MAIHAKCIVPGMVWIRYLSVLPRDRMFTWLLTQLEVAVSGQPALQVFVCTERYLRHERVFAGRDDPVARLSRVRPADGLGRQLFRRSDPSRFPFGGSRRI